MYIQEETKNKHMSNLFSILCLYTASTMVLLILMNDGIMYREIVCKILYNSCSINDQID